jgi:hypothetical protein
VPAKHVTARCFVHYYREHCGIGSVGLMVLTKVFLHLYIRNMGTADGGTVVKVAGSIPDGVSGIFH